MEMFQEDHSRAVRRRSRQALKRYRVADVTGHELKLRWNRA